jgi:hypothetical protein
VCRRVCNYSPRTIEAYVAAVAKLAKHFRRSPDQLSAEEVRAFQVQRLAQQASWSQFNQIVAGLRFFFGITLARPGMVEMLPYGKKPKRLPVVLSVDEVAQLLEAARPGRERILLQTAYACGLRISALLNLQVTDIDSARMVVNVRQGKGAKDRQVPLSGCLLRASRTWWSMHRRKPWLFPGCVERSWDRPMQATCVQLIEHVLRLLQQFLNVCEFAERQVQSAAPEVGRGALGDRSSMGRDAGQAEFAPGTHADRRQQSLRHQDGANAVLQGHASADQLLPMLDQRPLLADLLRGNGHGRELAQQIDLGQSQRVVTIGLALEVLELPRLAGRVRHQALDAQLDAQIADPTAEQAGLDQDHRRLMFRQEPDQLGPAGADGGELLVVCTSINTSNALVFAQVDGQNGAGRGCDDRVHCASSCGGVGVCWP